MDITNNLATKNLIRTLNKARILIVIAKEQFDGTRLLDNYKKFIKLFAAYFFNVNKFKDSINIILTKGLTAKSILKKIEEIEITNTFKNTSWSTNEKNFKDILKDKLEEIKNSKSK